MKKLKTGDVRRFENQFWTDDKDSWAVIDIYCGRLSLTFTGSSRSSARRQQGWGRIAKILKITPKTVTVQISK